MIVIQFKYNERLSRNGLLAGGVGGGVGGVGGGVGGVEGRGFMSWVVKAMLILAKIYIHKLPADRTVDLLNATLV